MVEILNSNSFDIWNTEKQIIHIKQNTDKIFFKEREIWWCHLGVNIGHEQNGKGQRFLRPILILKKLSKDAFYAIPLTTTRRLHKYLLICNASDSFFRQAHISQMRLLDSKRLYRKIAIVEKESFETIRKAVRELF